MSMEQSLASIARRRLPPFVKARLYRIYAKREPLRNLILEWAVNPLLRVCNRLDYKLSWPAEFGLGVPLPPNQLIKLVAHIGSLQWFLESGLRNTYEMRLMLMHQGKRIEDFGSVLDFGCGCGRMIRHLGHLKTRLYGTDYNPKLIKWCSKNLPFAKFTVNEARGRLPYSDSAFDLIYGWSVFTHLTPEQQHFWVEELHRVLQPGGYLWLSFQSEYFENLLPPDAKSAYDAEGLAVVKPEVAGTNECNTFQTEETVREMFADRFEVAEYIARGGISLLDLCLLRKREY